MNPRPGNDDESKMRGHLGTELGNKVSDTFISVKKKDADTGQYTYTVRQDDARSKPVEDWEFTITDDAGLLGIPKIIGRRNREPESKDVTPNDIIEWLDSAENDNTISWPLSKSEIKKLVFEKIGGITNHNSQDKCLKIAMEYKLLTESDVKVKGHYKLNISPERPFNIEVENSVTKNGRYNERYVKDEDSK